MSMDPIEIGITVNGSEVRRTVRPDKLLLDFLHEELELTGTKFACGIGACGACKVAVMEKPGGKLLPVLACFARMNAVNGMHVVTVEGLSSGETLHPLQEAFLEDYAFQCGFSTSGFLMAAHVLMDQLRREPVERRDLDQTILDAVGGHVCRCTGYTRYIRAIKRVIEQTDGLVVDHVAASSQDAITFRIVKQSSNDLVAKTLVGRFLNPTGKIELVGGLSFDTCRGSITVRTDAIATGEPARDLNLARFFFVGAEEITFELARAEPIDRSTPSSDLLSGLSVPMTISGSLRFAGASVPVALEVFVNATSAATLRVVSRSAFRFDPRDLALPIAAFAEEFGLTLKFEVEVSVDCHLPYAIV